MTFISFNINGLRASINKKLGEFLKTTNADFILLQETKIHFSMKDFLQKYYSAWNFSQNIGYSGIAIFSKYKPTNINYDTCSNFNSDGRILTFEYPSFFLVNVYVPNSKGNLSKWYYRIAFDEALNIYLSKLLNKKPLIIGGDFNVAHNYMDIYPENTKNFEAEAGFRAEERNGFDNILKLGLIDTFRYLNNNRAYTWWSYNNRKSNKGRRIDYFLVSENLKNRISSSTILTNISISDHAPIKLVIN